MNYYNRLCLSWVLGGCILFAFSGCGGEASEKAVSSEVIDDSFRSYAIDIDRPDVPLTELIESVEVMRLEETDESLLGGPGRMIRAGDKLILAGTGDVHIFSDKGEFIRKFNRRGDGPGEYGIIQSVWMSGDTIVLYDNQKQMLRWYDQLGNDLKEQKVPESASHVYPLENGYVLDMDFRAIADTLTYKLLLVDEQMENKAMLLPYEQGVPFPISTNMNSFKEFDGKLLYKSVFGDTIYFVGPQRVEPFFHIDFGDKYLWNDVSLSGNGQAAMNAIPEGRGVWLFMPSAGPEKIFMLYNVSFTDYGMMLIDRKTGDYQKLDLSKNPEEKYGFVGSSWHGDRLLSTITSTDVAEFLAELEEDQWSFREGTTLEEIESSENPVLMWVKFKDLIE